MALNANAAYALQSNTPFPSDIWCSVSPARPENSSGRRSGAEGSGCSRGRGHGCAAAGRARRRPAAPSPPQHTYYDGVSIGKTRVSGCRGRRRPGRQRAREASGEAVRRGGGEFGALWFSPALASGGNACTLMIKDCMPHLCAPTSLFGRRFHGCSDRRPTQDEILLNEQWG